nr:cytochrome P450 3A21-like [Biomphalaria glabrata]
MDFLGIVDIPTWLLILVTCGVLYVYYMTSTHGTFKKLGIPGPQPLPVLGNALYVVRKGLFDSIVDGYKYYKHHKMYGIFEGRTPVLTVTDLDLLKEILVKQSNNFTNRRQYASMAQRYLDTILFIVKDNEWKQLRATLKSSFTSSRLKAMHPKMAELLKQMFDVLKEQAKDKGQVEISSVIGCFCMDFIASIGFEHNCDSLHNPQNDFMRVSRNVLDSFAERTFFFEFFSPPFVKPVLDQLGINILPKSDILFLRKFVTKAMEARSQRVENPDDFLQYLIHHCPGLGLDKSATEGGLTLEQIYGSALTMILAGYDTSAKGFHFAVYLLAMHPECFSRAQREVDEVLQWEFPNPTNVGQLTYLDMCIKESIRMYPLGFFFERTCNKETILQGVKIPKDMIIRVPVAGIHSDPEIYTEPFKFIPERFADDKSRHPMAFIPFGAGPRSCFGEQLAMQMMKVGLAAFLQNCWTLLVNKDIDLQNFEDQVFRVRCKPMWIVWLKMYADFHASRAGKRTSK